MVSADNDKVRRSKLEQMYHESELAHAIFDYFATRRKNSVSTKTDRMLSILYELQGGADRPQVIQFFRNLEAAGCGEYVEGRRGHPSRFEWSVQLITVGLAAAGKPTPVKTISESEEEEDTAGSHVDVDHPFRLRAEKVITLSLPNDLTNQEAQRIADFVKTLPMSA